MQLTTAYLSHLNPMLHHPGPVRGPHPLVPEARCDDTAANTLELADGGLDGGCQMFFTQLRPLRPDGMQTVESLDFPEQLLGRLGVSLST